MLCVFEYAEDIHQHMRESEVWNVGSGMWVRNVGPERGSGPAVSRCAVSSQGGFRPRPGFLQNHPEITGDMRAVLVNWMVEVVREYELRSETLHLSVNYLDRFLSQTASVRRDKLQLVGTSALMIAA